MLLAEMMVQRTRAEQAERVWRQFVAAYPTLQAAREATDEQLLALLQPIGLAWRARNIVAAIRTSAGSPVGTRAIAGVDHYVENAVRCFAGGERAAIVDSNVVRVYSRFLGFSADDGTRRSIPFHRLATAMLPRQHVEEYNWGLLDLGATICRPRDPECGDCPLSSRCRITTTRSYAR
ncbi:MAG: hypothetical protein KJ048_16470 [Dehalococcoidia bacterium]|nr:hypothetical protein [Dehalococcoidia bacterium]